MRAKVRDAVRVPGVQEREKRINQHHARLRRKQEQSDRRLIASLLTQVEARTQLFLEMSDEAEFAQSAFHDCYAELQCAEQARVIAEQTLTCTQNQLVVKEQRMLILQGNLAKKRGDNTPGNSAEHLLATLGHEDALVEPLSAADHSAILALAARLQSDGDGELNSGFKGMRKKVTVVYLD